MGDPVNHPDHYNWIPGVECLQVVEWFPFNIGNAIKYLWRYKHKNPDKAIEDLRKARFYIDQEIKHIEEYGVQT